MKKILKPTAGSVLVTTLLVSALTMQANAGELIYTPINPSFGGDPFMGSYLLGKAQAQDTTTSETLNRSLQPNGLSKALRADLYQI